MSSSSEPLLELPATTGISTAHHRLDLAAIKATELVQRFANVDDPYSTDPANPWLHPDRIFQALRDARDELVEAWNNFEQESHVLTMTSDQKDNDKKQLDPERCRALYMDMITDAFADTLDDMRKTEGDNNLNVDILVDCLQSGLDLLTTDEQEALFFSKAMDHEFDNDDDHEALQGEANGNHENLTCHEKRRREMGLDVHTLG